MFFKNLCVLVLWTKVPSAFKGLKDWRNNRVHNFKTTFNQDSMVQWQHCRPECWEAWDPEFNSRPGRVGVRFLYKLGQPPKTFISYSLLSVAQLLGEITLKSFLFISYHRSCYLCCLHIQKSSPSYMSEPPLKKGVANPYKNKKTTFNQLYDYVSFSERWSYRDKRKQLASQRRKTRRL